MFRCKIYQNIPTKYYVKATKDAFRRGMAAFVKDIIDRKGYLIAYLRYDLKRGSLC